MSDKDLPLKFDVYIAHTEGGLCLKGTPVSLFTQCVRCNTCDHIQWHVLYQQGQNGGFPTCICHVSQAALSDVLVRVAWTREHRKNKPSGQVEHPTTCLRDAQNQSREAASHSELLGASSNTRDELQALVAQSTVKTEMKISTSVGQTAGSAGRQCRTEFTSGANGINHQVPLQVLSSSSFSGSCEPKPYLNFHNEFLLLFWFGPFTMSKQVQTVT